MNSRRQERSVFPYQLTSRNSPDRPRLWSQSCPSQGLLAVQSQPAGSLERLVLQRSWFSRAPGRPTSRSSR
ncbi:unnamed protein product [Boreogadus saida]